MKTKKVSSQAKQEKIFIGICIAVMVVSFIIVAVRYVSIHGIYWY